MQPNITALLAAFRAKNLPVVHIHHVEAAEEHSYWNEKSHPEGVLPQEYVAPQPGEPVLRKYDRSSGFHARERDGAAGLKDVLDARGVDTVVLVGQSSPHCVSSTARSGYDRGLSVVVVGDACATYPARNPQYGGAAKGDAQGDTAWSAETVHGIAMAHLADGGIAQVVGTDVVLKNL
ncbi:Isochorismatase-like protein [Mycena galericulata]|nr:Isochorismatase-like protein [Mycena galericulata]